jgi:hypothetical protein
MIAEARGAKSANAAIDIITYIAFIVNSNTNRFYIKKIIKTVLIVKNCFIIT